MDGQRRDAWIAGQMDRCMGGGAGKGGCLLYTSDAADEDSPV